MKVVKCVLDKLIIVPTKDINIERVIKCKNVILDGYCTYQSELYFFRSIKTNDKFEFVILMGLNKFEKFMYKFFGI